MKKTLFRALFFCSALVLTGVLVFTGCSDGGSEAPRESEKNITSFSFNDVSGAIRTDTGAITVYVPVGTDVTSLAPEITVSEGATVSPASGAANDFTYPTTYLVTGKDKTTKTYVVTVSLIGLSSISVLNSPVKTQYVVGEELDITGLVVRGYYTDGSYKIETVTAANISNYDKSRAGSQQVIITINGRTTTFSVTVSAAESLILTLGLVPGGNDNLEIYGIPAGGIKLSVGRNNGLPDKIVISAGASSNQVYSNIEWYVNASQLSNYNNIVTINASDYAFTIPHTITLVATKLDGSRHSQTITFTVEL